MNYLKYFFGIAIAAALLAGCEKERLMTYGGGDNIYFTNNYNNKIDTGMVSFGYAPPSVKDLVVKIPVSVMGAITTADRSFKVTIAESSTAKAGTHYEALQDTFRIRAGKKLDTLLLKLYRPADIQTNAVSIILQLQPNEYFSTSMQTRITNSNTGAYYSYVTYRLIVNDFLTQPKYWLSVYSGVFTRKKIILMSQVLGVGIEEISNNSSIPQQIYWGRTMQLYLNQQKASGNTIYEEDGTPMAMGSAVQ